MSHNITALDGGELTFDHSGSPHFVQHFITQQDRRLRIEIQKSPYFCVLASALDTRAMQWNPILGIQRTATKTHAVKLAYDPQKEQLFEDAIHADRDELVRRLEILLEGL